MVVVLRVFLLLVVADSWLARRSAPSSCRFFCFENIQGIVHVILFFFVFFSFSNIRHRPYGELIFVIS